MRHWTVAGWTGALAAIVSATVFMLMLYRASAMRDGGGTLSMDSLGWVLLIAALACLCLSVMLTVYGYFLKVSLNAKTVVSEMFVPESSAEAFPEAMPRPLHAVELTEDEMRLYERIEAAGGEILQMNLVSSGDFSKSKVTRLLDKLERRGLIKRERHGMTNLVRLVR